MPKIKVIPFVLLLLSMSVYAQEETTKNSKISIGISYAPNISYRSVKGDLLDLFTDNERVKYGQSLNLLSRYSFNNSWGVESGLLFQSRGFRFKKTDFEYEVDIERKGPAIPDKIEYSERFYYAGVPVKLTFKKDFKNVSFISSVGMVANYLMGEYTVLNADFGGEVTKGKYNNSERYNRFGLSAIIGAGIEWQLTNNYKFMMMPTFQRDLTSIVDSNIKTYLWDLGLNIGVIYKL